VPNAGTFRVTLLPNAGPPPPDQLYVHTVAPPVALAELLAASVTEPPVNPVIVVGLVRVRVPAHADTPLPPGVAVMVKDEANVSPLEYPSLSLPQVHSAVLLPCCDVTVLTRTIWSLIPGA